MSRNEIEEDEGICNQNAKQNLNFQNLTLQKRVDIYRASEKASAYSQGMGVRGSPDKEVTSNQ